MTRNTPSSTAQIILLDLVEHNSPMVYPMLRRFAAAGEISVLRDALEAGIPQRLSSAGSPVFALVAPLREAPVDQRAAEDFIDQWLDACGNPDQGKLDWALGATDDPTCAADLLAFGANPNAWIDTGSGPDRTPIALAMGGKQLPVLEVMLRHLAERDEIPLYDTRDRTPEGGAIAKNLFDLFAAAATIKGDWREEVCAMDFLIRLGMPRSWSLEMGQALVRATQEHPLNVIGGGFVAVPRALALSAFEDKQQWVDIFMGEQLLFGTMVRRPDTHDSFFLSTFRQAIADGAQIDEIPCFIGGISRDPGSSGLVKRIPVSPLQAAVVHKDADLVKAFIELGSDLTSPLPARVELDDDLCGATLVQVAQRRSSTEIEQMLSSAIAKQRVDEVIANARQRNKGNAP